MSVVPRTEKIKVYCLTLQRNPDEPSFRFWYSTKERAEQAAEPYREQGCPAHVKSTTIPLVRDKLLQWLNDNAY